MKKIALLPLLLVGALFAQGCAELSESFAGPLGVIAPSRVDRNCPAPSEDQLDNRHLKLEDGVTLKCQVKNYTSNMPCSGITDSTGTDGWACNSGDGRSILFIFDEKGILQRHGPVQ
jgi:hypothetical protein